MLTGTLILLTQTAYIPYITDMTMIGRLATQPGSTAFFNMFDPNDVSSAVVSCRMALPLLDPLHS
jgi:hypothetical protein